MDKELHTLLERQLKRCGLRAEELPTNINDWNKFIEKINKAYFDADQDRYLLERSMTISSDETQVLTQKLQTVQHIAKIGYWYYDPETRVNQWSNNLYQLFNYPIGVPIPDIDTFTLLIHENDRSLFTSSMRSLINMNDSFEIEIRVRPGNQTDKYRWFYFLGSMTNQSSMETKIPKIVNIIIDITKRKEAEQQVKNLHTKLITAARRAGMTDVATSVLHNMGNVINSVNVSMNMLIEHLNNNVSSKLPDVKSILEANIDNLPEFLVKDPKGVTMIKYMLKICSNYASSQELISRELNLLNSHITHIKNIIAMQQFIGRDHGFSEKLYVTDLIENALTICNDYINNNEIIITKSFSIAPQIVSDKTKILQILINLIKNACDAVCLSNKSEKNITISLVKAEKNLLKIIIQDNGVGIDKSNIIKMFSFGFTTKSNGHGYGLHSSAITARELAGDLTAESNGVGTGATFTLTLPMIMSQINEDEACKI